MRSFSQAFFLCQEAGRKYKECIAGKRLTVQTDVKEGRRDEKGQESVGFVLIVRIGTLHFCFFEGVK